MLTIISVSGLAWVVDAGQPGRMHEGIPPGGPLVPELFAAANRAQGNDARAPALEVHGRLVADLDGETLETISAPLRVGYLAVPGGLVVPRHQAMPLFSRPARRGDRFEVGPARGAPIAAPDWAPGAEIRVVLGPDAPVPALLETTFVISALGDRTGVRLAGRLPSPPPPSGISAPMVCGAIQLPPSGEPIVLGPDHPTTGGYPVIATIISEDRGRFFARPPGAEIRFQAALRQTALCSLS